MKKVLTILLLAALTVGLLAGCGPQAEQPGTDSDSASAAPAPSTDTDPSASSEPVALSPQETLEASEHLIGITDQKNSRIIVCDLAEEDWENDNAVVWEYQDQSCSSAAGIKFRYSEYWEEDVVIYCWHGGAAIVSYETKEVLFRTTNVGGNPHSVELLPDGHFIVASSTDNDVRIFPLASGEKGYSHKIEYPNAHGVLWDPKYEVVWMVGKNLLSAFMIGGTEDEPKFIPMTDMVYHTSKSGMHDLAPCYGDPDALFVTCSAGILKFDKVKEKFSSSYPGGSTGSRQSYAPGAGNFGHDDVLVFTTITEETMVMTDYCTNIINIFVPAAKGAGRLIRRKAPNDAYYKCRVWSTDYQ